MKTRNVSIILDNMSAIGFWVFMKLPKHVRWRILRRKVLDKKNLLMILLPIIFVVLTVNPGNISAEEEEGFYFSGSGLVVLMKNGLVGTRDTGFPMPNSHYTGGGPTDNNASFIINSVEGYLNGRERVLKGGDTGFGATMAVGKRFWDNFRGEIEFGYRQGGFEDINILPDYEQNNFWEKDQEWRVRGETPNAPYQGDWSLDIWDGGYKTRSLLANLIYDLPLTDKISFSLGGGVGLHWTTVNDGYENTGGSGLAYQALVGLNYRATANLEFFGGYRYFNTDAVPLLDQLMVEVDTDDIELGLRYYFDAPKKKKVSQGKSNESHDDGNHDFMDKFYVGISGGLVQQQSLANFNDGADWNLGISVDNIEMNAGYGVEAVVGYRLCSWCRVELEYSYKFSTPGSFSYRRPGGGIDEKPKINYEPELGHASGEISNRSIFHALLVNFHADLNFANIKQKFGILPFVGLGVGGMYMDAQTPRSDEYGWPSFSFEKPSFAIQMAAGVGYSLTNKITIGTQYKYLTTLGNDEIYGEKNYGVLGDVGVVRGENHNYRVNNIGIHSFGLFARYSF